MSGITSGQMQQQMEQIQDQMNQNQVDLYKMSSQNSFEQSMGQTLGQLAENAAKAKPQV